MKLAVDSLEVEVDFWLRRTLKMLDLHTFEACMARGRRTSGPVDE